MDSIAADFGRETAAVIAASFNRMETNGSGERKCGLAIQVTRTFAGNNSAGQPDLPVDIEVKMLAAKPEGGGRAL